MSEKSVLKNGFYNVVYKLLNAIYPLVIASYLARTLLPEGIGKVSYAQNIVMYFTIIAALGLPVYGTREIAKIRENSIETSRLFTELFSVNMLSTTICTVAYYAVVLFVPFFASERLLYIVAGLLIPLNYLNVDWYYQGCEEFKYIALRSISIKVLSIAAIFLFVNDVSDYIIYALIHCIVFAGNYIFNMFGLRGRIKPALKGISLKRHTKPLLILLATSVAIELYTLLDTTMLGIICSDEIVAYYSYAMKVSKIILTVIVAISAVLLPKLSYYSHNDSKKEFDAMVSKGVMIFILMSLPCTVGLFMVSQDLIPVLFGEAFLPATVTSQILSLLIVPITFSTFFGSQVLCSVGKEKKMLIAVCVGAAVNIALNIILIPRYEQNGAAIASVISEMLVLIVDIIFTVKIVKIKIDFSQVVKIIIALCSMALVVWIVQYHALASILSLIISVVSGALVYAILLYVLRVNCVFSLLHRKKQ